MGLRYLGNVISATPPDVSGNQTAPTASGIWTLNQQGAYQGGNNWPLTYDPYFNLTTLLLHANGTNGAQNNTFLDSSTNNFSITRSGNTTQGTFSPFSVAAGQFSNFFDGTGDTLTAADNADFDLGSGDWTIELWVNFGSVAGEKGLITHFTSAGSGQNNGYTLRLSTGNSPSGLRLVCSTTGTDVALQAAWTPVVGTWYHIAAVRDGGDLRIYVDGVQIGTTSIAITIGNPATTFGIGTAQTVASSDMNGYISNARLVKGTCLYTGGTTFTPPSSPLTAVSGTEILTCQSNRFVDNSTNNFAITRNGDVKVTPFSPFAPTAAYDASVNGGSGYFDGSDYLQVSDAGLALGTGDFSIQLWVYNNAFDGASGNNALFDYRNGSEPTTQPLLFMNNGQLRYYINGSAVITGATLKLNEWAFVGLSRVSGTTKLFVNGVQSGSNYTDTNNYTSSVIRIAADFDAILNAELNGYLSGFKITQGTAVDFSALGVPTSPPTDDANTELLLNFTNAGIFDQTGKNNLETVADAQIDTTTKKFGTGSMEFDGTGDYLVIPDSPLFSFGSGPFTIEFWIYPSATANTAIIDARASASAVPWGIFYDAADMEPYFYTGSSYKSSTALSTGAWQHLAVTRDSSSTLKMFLDGVEVHSTGSVTTSLDRSGTILIGINKSSSNAFTGFIDDLRITKGVARYTSNFTPPQFQFFDT